ncbi:MAG: hypothetical protein MUC96_00400 [Myxococcaceae bacterium]|jgi:hypothetical protein|nr:hypothetical protein [Myxococcaceae bacterium]
MRSLLLPLLAVLAAACGPTTIDAKDYNQVCTTNADCALVSDGDACAVCAGCQSAAINVADLGKYTRDQTAAKNACPPRLGPQPVCAAAACLQPEAFCNAGTCASRPVQR